MDLEDLGLVVEQNRHLPPRAAKTDNHRGLSGWKRRLPLRRLAITSSPPTAFWLNKTNSCPPCRHELPTTMTLTRGTDEISLTSSSRSTDLKTSTEPCTQEVAGAEHWSSPAPSSGTSNPH
ncbi:hypothetical protein GH733_001160 [Mirounga leonina]|nr:hypothetical protein GH733_001160 [Mirounga leonina]